VERRAVPSGLLLKRTPAPGWTRGSSHRTRPSRVDQSTRKTTRGALHVGIIRLQVDVNWSFIVLSKPVHTPLASATHRRSAQEARKVAAAAARRASSSGQARRESASGGKSFSAQPGVFFPHELRQHTQQGGTAEAVEIRSSSAELVHPLWLLHLQRTAPARLCLQLASCFSSMASRRRLSTRTATCEESAPAGAAPDPSQCLWPPDCSYRTPHTPPLSPATCLPPSRSPPLLPLAPVPGGRPAFPASTYTQPAHSQCCPPFANAPSPPAETTTTPSTAG
jgi:hypothetical protein